MFAGIHEPVAIKSLASAALLGGGIVLLGACYAVFLALARLQTLRWANAAALASYAALAVCVVAFALVLELRGFWLLLIAIMLVGYFVAPRFIWRLSHVVHESEGAFPDATPHTGPGLPANAAGPGGKHMEGRP